MKVQYIGEHVLAGWIGQFSILMSFVLVLAAFVFYLLSNRNEGRTWVSQVARGSFFGHLIFIVIALVDLGWLIFNHCFEYQYVWQYSDVNLAPHFLLSSLWAGQEGSYLVWIFWQSVLGALFIRWGKTWEKPTMIFVSLAQVFLMIMILGVRFGNISIGLNAFEMLRNLPENAGNELFRDPNYVSLIVNGNGLNPLLENIWMVIHPPILFLGYASVLIPFSLALGGFWKRDYLGWRTPALPWINFSALVLGLGILLGGAWAYVSLTFGGFWAWDPVENASLVPWLAVMASLHTILIARKKPQNVIWAYFFACLAYVLVLYASFLTRSGVLSETSVHAFGKEGKTFPLAVFTLVFLLISLITVIFRVPRFDDKGKENMTSREFWMFIGAIVLILSAFQVISTTSIPVINKLFGTNLAPPTDGVAYYNAWQLPYAILVALLIGITQYMRYGESPYPAFLRRTIPALIAALLLTMLFNFIYPFPKLLHYFFLFFLVFSIFSVINALVNRIRKQKGIGASLAHLGMLLFLLGVLITFSKPNIISKTTINHRGMGNFSTDTQKLTKNSFSEMGAYQVKYMGVTAKDKYLIYQLDFHKVSGKGDTSFRFSLYPSILRNERMGNVFEPNTRTFLTKDVYAFVTAANEVEVENYIPGYTLLRDLQIGEKDTAGFGGVSFVLDSSIMPFGNDFSKGMLMGAAIKAVTASGTFQLKPMMGMMVGKTDFKMVYSDDSIPSMNWKIRYSTMPGHQKNVTLSIYEKSVETVEVKVMVFPYILLLWLGAALTFVGIIFALYKRTRGRKQEHTAEKTEMNVPEPETQELNVAVENEFVSKTETPEIKAEGKENVINTE